MFDVVSIEYGDVAMLTLEANIRITASFVLKLLMIISYYYLILH